MAKEILIVVDHFMTLHTVVSIVLQIFKFEIYYLNCSYMWIHIVLSKFSLFLLL